MGFYYKGLFQDMERHGVLDRHNPSDLSSLVAVFLPILQDSLKEVCSDWNNKPIRPQRARGIKQYRPVYRFTDAVLDMRNLTVEDLHLVCVQVPSLHLEVIEGSNRATQASDTIERSQHAPAVSSPLDAWEKAVCAELHGAFASDAAPVKSFLLHKQVVAQILLARGVSDTEWQQFVAAAPGGAADLCGQLRFAIWEKVYSMG